MSRKYVIPVLIHVFVIACCQAQYTGNITTSTLETKFLEILKADIEQSKNKISGISMTVFAPDQDIYWSGAMGFDSTEKTNKLSEAQPFRIASITKTFTASAILRLYEQGKLKLDDPITRYISDQHQSILQQGGYDPSRITIKQCLQHTSGLFDYAMGGNNYIKTARKNPTKRWTRTEQIQFAMDHGKPIGQPGEKYAYSDTGYILLGEIIEKLTEEDLAQALRSLLKFESLGLSSTWLESLESRPEELATSVHRYMGKLDATTWDNSVDLYGGGGLSSTTKDLATFFHALFNNKLFDHPETLSVMLSPSEVQEKDPSNDDYRIGLQRMVSRKYKTEAFFHEGFWNTVTVHIPEHNWTIAINYTNEYSNYSLSEAVGVIKDFKESKKTN